MTKFEGPYVEVRSGGFVHLMNEKRIMSYLWFDAEERQEYLRMLEECKRQGKDVVVAEYGIYLKMKDYTM